MISDELSYRLWYGGADPKPRKVDGVKGGVEENDASARRLAEPSIELNN